MYRQCGAEPARKQEWVEDSLEEMVQEWAEDRFHYNSHLASIRAEGKRLRCKAQGLPAPRPHRRGDRQRRRWVWRSRPKRDSADPDGPEAKLAGRHLRLLGRTSLHLWRYLIEDRERSERTWTLKRLAERAKIPYRTAKRALSRLREMGIVEAITMTHRGRRWCRRISIEAVHGRVGVYRRIQIYFLPTELFSSLDDLVPARGFRDRKAAAKVAPYERGIGPDVTKVPVANQAVAHQGGPYNTDSKLTSERELFNDVSYREQTLGESHLSAAGASPPHPQMPREQPAPRPCGMCSAIFPASSTGRPRLYCSDVCRQRALRARRAGAPRLAPTAPPLLRPVLAQPVASQRERRHRAYFASDGYLRCICMEAARLFGGSSETYRDELRDGELTAAELIERCAEERSRRFRAAGIGMGAA